MNSTPRRQPNILAVDDTPANLQLLLQILQENGYRMRAVTSGAEALETVRTETPDLILLDITMPEMDGYEVCRRLKADPATAEIPVLFISALAEVEDKVHAFEVGGVDYVSKPFQNAEVAARVRTHLKLRQHEQELQQRERELEESLAREQESRARELELERLRDKLTHMIAHDMRSPLQAVRLSLDLLRDGVRLDYADMLACAKTSIDSLVDMVSQMLDVSRMEAGALELQPEAVDLADLAQVVLTALRPLAGGITVRLETTGAIEVNADRSLIRRVLANLVGNAFKFTPDKGHVTVRISERDGQARVEVVDDGQGIAPEHHGRIFEKFGQVNAGKKKVGTGLGLTFVKMAVEAHGGAIGVLSAPGQGSTFWFALPLAERPAAATTLPANP
jgi:two-component system sensor histidine kinase/response regulator